MGGLNLKGLSSQALINMDRREQIKRIGKGDLLSRFFSAPDMVVIFESWGCQKNSEALVKRLV